MSSPIFKYNPPPAINLVPIYDDRSFNAAYKSAKDAKSEVDQQIALISQERLPIEEELAESREQVFAARKYITDTATSQAWFAIFTASVMTEQIHASPEIEQVENFLGMDEVTGGLLDTAKIGIDAWELGTKINNLVLKSRIIENAQVHLETLKVQHNNNLEDPVLKTRIAQTEDFINKQTVEHEKMKNELLNSSAKQAVFSQRIFYLSWKVFINSALPPRNFFLSCGGLIKPLA